MKWNQTDLEQFLGCQPTLGLEADWIYMFHYASKRLRYELWVDEKENRVFVSGDPETPFGADSLYEVYVPCDTIELFPDPYHAGFKAVSFWHGGTSERRNLRLTIMKRPDGDLKVWPSFPLPESHCERRKIGEP